MKLLKIVPVVIAMALTMQPLGAGMDGQKSEKRDALLSLLDVMLYNAYSMKIGNSLHKKDKTVAAQKEWEKSLALCQNRVCRVKSYLERIRELLWENLDLALNTRYPTELYSLMGEHYSSEFDECLDRSGGVTNKMIRCIVGEMEKIERYTEYLERRVRRYIRYGIDQGIYSEEKLKKLDQAKKSWRDYRDAECSFYYSKGSGTLDTIIVNDCYLSETYRWMVVMSGFLSHVEDR